MLFNETIEYEIVTDLETEPATLQELKQELNMLFDTDGSYEFGDDDTLLERKLTAARLAVEQYTGLSFGEKTIKAVLRNEKGDVEIPYGPVRTITSIKDVDGNTIASTDYKVIGLNYKRICYPTYSYLLVEYTAGYENLPSVLKEAILAQAVYLYNHRGEQEDTGLCKTALELSTPFKRTGWIV